MRYGVDYNIVMSQRHVHELRCMNKVTHYEQFQVNFTCQCGADSRSCISRLPGGGLHGRDFNPDQLHVRCTMCRRKSIEYQVSASLASRSVTEHRKEAES